MDNLKAYYTSAEYSSAPLHLPGESQNPSPPQQSSGSCPCLPSQISQRPQLQDHSYPSWLTSGAPSPTADASARGHGYDPMADDTIDLDRSCSNSDVAQWFALETTAEDRLSWDIIREELKDLCLELFHFLKNRNWKKKLMTVTVIVASGLVFYDLAYGEHIRTWIDALLIWITDYPAAAIFVFMAIYVLATILFIPPTLLLFGAGWSFAEAWGNVFEGVVAALICCFFGSIIGAMLSFVRARYLMRDLIELFAKRYPIVKAADAALKRDGFRIMLLLRLCPLIPFHSLNYLGGITDVSYDTFLFSLVGILPYQVLVITMGATTGTLHSTAAMKKYAEENQTHQYGNDDRFLDDAAERQQNLENLLMLIVTCVGLATLLIALVLAFRYTKKELQKELQIGDGDIKSYLKTVRRMSMIDLIDSCTMETDEGMEVITSSKSKLFAGE